ncbi:MAG: hypothetical protein J2P37_07245 [Ktedonobacteraceae bacterium]|nr:hypothetical protein [Ktedonobacteraceae bacterium]
MKRPPLRDVLGLFVSSRFLLIMVTYFGYILLTSAKYSSEPVDIAGLFSSWNHWDAANYVSIAQYGYTSKYQLAFFPLFPLLISSVAFPFGSWGYMMAGMIISNLALLGSMFVLYQLALEFGGDLLARRTLLYLCIFPTALFFFAAYNESLFLFLASSFFLALRRKQWWLAGMLGMLAALTRSLGPMLAIPYLYELWLARDSILASKKNTIAGVAPIILIPVGTLLYSFYCWKSTGNPFMFAAVQDNWARQAAPPWSGLWQAIVELVAVQPFGSFYQAHILLDLGATAGFIALLIAGWNRIRTSYSIWMATMLVCFLLAPSLGQHDSLISNQRFVLELFPGFIVLAMLSIKYPRLHNTLVIIFPALLATLSIIFVMNRWMV